MLYVVMEICSKDYNIVFGVGFIVHTPTWVGGSAGGASRCSLFAGFLDCSVGTVAPVVGVVQ
jgi:hypothetical protein